MTFEYDAAGTLARIKADLSRRPESQKPEVIPARLADPAKAGSAAQGSLAGLASLAGISSNLRTSGHAAQAVSPPTEDQKPEGTPAKVANLLKQGVSSTGEISKLAGLAGVPPDFHAGDHTTKTVSSPIEDQKSARTPAKVAKAANPLGPATSALIRRAPFKERAAFTAGGGGISTSSCIIASAGTDITDLATGEIASSPAGEIAGAPTGDTGGSVSDDFTVSHSDDITSSSDITDITGAGADDTDSSGSACAGSSGSAARRQATQSWDPADWRAHYDEKAAISEFDHGMSRQQAEALAYEFCLSRWLYEHPMSSNADDGCLVCNEPDRAGDPLLAIGLGGGEVWLHWKCSAAWRAGRLAEAIGSLAAMGIGDPEDGST